MIEKDENIDSSLYRVDDRGKHTFNYLQVVKFFRDKYTTISFNSKVFIYHDGMYTDGTGRIKSEISDLAVTIGISGSITRPTSEIMHYLQTLGADFEYPFNKYKNTIPVNNGVVEIDFINGTFELVPHDPKYRFNYKLAVDYVDVDENTVRTIHNDALCKYVGESRVNVLYQLMAQPLLQALGSAPFKKGYLLQGDPDAGKSSFLEIPLRMYGSESHSHVALQRLAEDRFALAELEHKMLNVYDDLSNVPMKDAGIIKATTGSRTFSIQRKGETGYDADIFAVHVYTCNTPLEVGDRVQSDTAFWERFEYVEFISHFSNDPYFYEHVFTSENLSVLFYDILVHAVHIQKHGLYFESTASEVRELWNYSADPLYKFLETEMEPCDNSVYIDKDKFLESYTRWCHSNDVITSKIHPNTNSFTRALDKYRIIATKISTSSGRPQCYEMPYRWSTMSLFNCDCLIPSKTQSTL